MKTVLGCVRKADTDFNMISPGDRVAVGISGGKDSLLLLYALSLYRSSIKQIVALRETVNQCQETLTLSLELYKQGLTQFQNVLDAQRTLLNYRNYLVQARASSLKSLIGLYEALGGGWQ